MRRPVHRGISTLEMVLCLPLLLMVMALMINYGVVASWNVRSLAISRHAAWSTRWPRNGDRLPRPDYWPKSATVTAQGAGDIPSLDDPRVDRPVVRGPLANGNTVDRRLLDPSQGLREGESTIERQFPMLPRLGDLPSGFRRSFPRRQKSVPAYQGPRQCIAADSGNLSTGPNQSGSEERLHSCRGGFAKLVGSGTSRPAVSRRRIHCLQLEIWAGTPHWIFGHECIGFAHSIKPRPPRMSKILWIGFKAK